MTAVPGGFYAHDMVNAPGGSAWGHAVAADDLSLAMVIGL